MRRTGVMAPLGCLLAVLLSLLLLGPGRPDARDGGAIAGLGVQTDTNGTGPRLDVMPLAVGMADGEDDAVVDRADARPTTRTWPVAPAAIVVAAAVVTGLATSGRAVQWHRRAPGRRPGRAPCGRGPPPLVAS